MKDALHHRGYAYTLNQSAKNTKPVYSDIPHKQRLNKWWEYLYSQLEQGIIGTSTVIYLDQYKTYGMDVEAAGMDQQRN